MQAIYSWEVNPKVGSGLLSFPWLELDQEQPEEEVRIEAMLVVKQWQQHQLEVDRTIADHLINWHFSRLYPVDRALLRLGTSLLLDRRQLSAALVINETVLLAKEFGTDNSYRLLNGVLNSIAGWINEKGNSVADDQR